MLLLVVLAGCLDYGFEAADRGKDDYPEPGEHDSDDTGGLDTGDPADSGDTGGEDTDTGDTGPEDTDSGEDEPRAPVPASFGAVLIQGYCSFRSPRFFLASFPAPPSGSSSTAFS